MIRFSHSLQAWGTPEFAQTVKTEIRQLEAHQLPLQQGLQHGSHVSEDGFEVMLLNSSENPDSIRIKAGIFYSSVIAGCNCADDPTPVDVLTEYCEVQVDIDKSGAEVTIRLLAEQDGGAVS